MDLKKELTAFKKKCDTGPCSKCSVNLTMKGNRYVAECFAFWLEAAQKKENNLPVVKTGIYKSAKDFLPEASFITIDGFDFDNNPKGRTGITPGHEQYYKEIEESVDYSKIPPKSIVKLTERGNANEVHLRFFESFKNNCFHLYKERCILNTYVCSIHYYDLEIIRWGE
jgi:hypothetical protein